MAEASGADGLLSLEFSTEADLARIRRHLRAAAATHEDLLFNLELIATELATNALLHGGGRGSLALRRRGACLRIEVEDESMDAPSVGIMAAEGLTGRGLGLIAALASEWGVERGDRHGGSGGGGKVVWAEVCPDGADGVPLDADSLLDAWDDPFDDAVTLDVELGDVPTPLLVAAKRHVDNIIRELTLAEGGRRSGTTQAVPGELSELFRRVASGFQHAREQIKRQATEAARRDDPVTALHLRLAPDDADAAEAYLTALDELDNYSRANRLLTLETPPQHRVFRRWYVREIVRQLRAASSGRPVGRATPFMDQILTEIDAAEHARRGAERAARLYAVSFALASATTSESVARAVLDEAVPALGAIGGGILLSTSEDRLSLAGSVGYDEPTVARLREEPADADLPAAHALRSGEVVWLETSQAIAQRFPALSHLEPGTRAICALPLVVGGTTVGALRFSFGDHRLFDDDERTFILSLAAEAADAVQRVQLLVAEREARQRYEHERASLFKVAAVGEAMLRGQDLATVLQLATDAATQVCDAAFGAFFYNDVDETGDAYLLVTLSRVDQEAFAGFPMPRKTAIFGPTFRGEQVLRLDDVTSDPRYGQSAPFFGMPPGHLPVRSYLAVPVVSRSGAVEGGLFLGHPEPGRFTADHEQLVVGVAGQAATAIQLLRLLGEGRDGPGDEGGRGDR